MGQRCYLAAGNSISERSVPWAWYIVGGAPGTTAVHGARASRNRECSGYDFALKSPIDSARRHVVNQFDGIHRLLWVIWDRSASTRHSGKPFDAGILQRPSVAQTLRRFFVVFQPRDYLNVLRQLCSAPAGRSTVTLDASQLMELGEDGGRDSHLKHWASFVIANRLLDAAVALDIQRMCSIFRLDRRHHCLFPYDDYLTGLPKSLVGWCRLTFDWENTEQIAEYLLTPEQLERMDGYSFF